MEKKELINILNEKLVPLGFNKKGYYWSRDDKSISKVINLQKSKFGDSFYINYGFVLKSIPLDNLAMHIFKGFGSSDKNENARIKQLLDLENSIPDEDRREELKKNIADNLLVSIQEINTEEELIRYLKKQPNLNDVPLVVKKHLKLE